MEAQSMTESAALVKIVKQFFDGTTEISVANASKEKDNAIAELRADITQLQRRLAVMEQAIVSRQQLKSAKSRTSYHAAPPKLPPQTLSELARRLGVGTGTVESAYQKGEAYFKDWSKRLDPAKKSWHKRGELFHPESD
jgi:hypothetical protein